MPGQSRPGWAKTQSLPGRRPQRRSKREDCSAGPFVVIPLLCVAELQSADQILWGKIVELYNHKQWTLDDAVHEPAEIRADIASVATPPLCTFFFPRVRTPCGHDAQVIIEGREIQSDGGEKDKDNPTTNQTKPTTAHRPRLHHQVVFPLY